MAISDTPAPDSGAFSGNTLSGLASNDFFLDDFATTDSFVKHEFENDDGDQFVTQGMIITNDGANPFEFSFSSKTQQIPHGSLNAGDTLTLDSRPKTFISVRSKTPSFSTTIRIWAWG